VDPVQDLLLLRKSGRAGNRTRDLWICSQKLWPHRRYVLHDVRLNRMCWASLCRRFWWHCRIFWCGNKRECFLQEIITLCYSRKINISGWERTQDFLNTTGGDGRWQFLSHIVIMTLKIRWTLPYLSSSSRLLTVGLLVFIYGSVVLYWTLAAFCSFLIFYTVGRTPWTEDKPVARPLPTHRTTETQNKRTQTSVPQVGFEPTVPVFERAQTARPL
jgi:hypothetical protein